MEFIKKILRFIYYKNERQRIFRERHIIKVQDKMFKDEYDEEICNLIIFLVDGADWKSGTDLISGGILSIASIFEESQKLKSIHQSEIIMATLPKAYLLGKHIQFPNNIHVYRFNQLINFKNLENVLIHVPEYRFNMEVVNRVSKIFSYLEPRQIHFNILNQRLDLMPSPSILKQSVSRGFILTQTTAHEQYSTAAIKAKFGIPLHKLSVYATPARYNFKKYEDKENLILVSPDPNKDKDHILLLINEALPSYSIEIIENLTYTEYLNKIERAKFMITFGEGLDFYFIETVFSGGISFSVYNTMFFTEKFKGLDGVFESYESMKSDLISMIVKMDNSKDFKEVNKMQFKTVNQIYNDYDFRENLLKFYKKQYTFPRNE